MSYGMRQAGIHVVAGLDSDKNCQETYLKNNPDAQFILTDITEAGTQILSEAGIKTDDDNFVFIGCSPCQYWSIINTDRKKSEQSANLLTHFQRFVEYYNPGYVVIENVPGIKHNADKSKLNAFIDFLEKHEYSYDEGIINANFYGVPQNRKRFVLIASRVRRNIKLPAPDSAGPVTRNYLGIENGFKKIAAGHKDETGFRHSSSRLSETNFKRLVLTPKDGGTRKSWSTREDLQLETYKGRDNCFKDVYGRMFWNKPAPTITTRFISLSNGRFGHPDENRAISLREGAALQTFPHSYTFCSDSMKTTAKLIGNAVPPELARRIGLVLQGETIKKGDKQ